MSIPACHKCEKKIGPMDKFCPHCNTKVSKFHRIWNIIGNKPVYLILLALISVLLLDLAWVLLVETGESWALFLLIILLLPVVLWILNKAYKLAVPVDLSKMNILPRNKICPHCNEKISKFYMMLNKIGNNHLYLILLVFISTFLLSLAWTLRVESGQKWIIYLGIIILLPLVPWILKHIYKYVAPADLNEKKIYELYIFCPHCNVKTGKLHGMMNTIGNNSLYLTLTIFAFILLLDVAWFLRMEMGQGWIIYTVMTLVALFIPWIFEAAYKLAEPVFLDEKNIEQIDESCPHCNGNTSKFYKICNKIGNKRLYYAVLILLSILLLSIVWFLRIETGQKWIIYLGIIMLVPFVPEVLIKAYKSAASIKVKGKLIEAGSKICPHCNVKVNIFYGILDTIGSRRFFLVLFVLIFTLLLDMVWFLGMEIGQQGIILAFAIMLIPAALWVSTIANEIGANINLAGKIRQQADKFRLKCKEMRTAFYEILDKIENNRFCLILLVLISILLLGIAWFLRMQTGEKWIIYVVIIMLMPLVPWILKVAYKIAAPITEDEKKEGNENK